MGLLNGERLWHVLAVRSGVDVLDDRVGFRRIEVGGPNDDAVDVGRAVATLGDEAFGSRPTRRTKFSHLGLFELGDQPATAGPPQVVDRGNIDP